MTPIKLIRKIVDDRRERFNKFTTALFLPLLIYMALDLFDCNKYIRIFVAWVLSIVIRHFFFFAWKVFDDKDLRDIEDDVAKEVTEMGELLSDGRLYKDNSIKQTVINLGKKLESLDEEPENEE